MALVCGGIRRGSLNGAVMRAAEARARASGEFESVRRLRIDHLPFYDADVDAEAPPAAATELRGDVVAAGALLVCTPEYNWSLPGVLKNALDWLSRPPGQAALAGRLVATMSASTGQVGGGRAQEHLRTVLQRCGAVVFDYPMVVFPRAADSLDEHGELTDPEAIDKIDGLLGALADELSGAEQSAAVG